MSRALTRYERLIFLELPRRAIDPDWVGAGPQDGRKTGDGRCLKRYGASSSSRAISPEGRLLVRADQGIGRLWAVAMNAQLPGVGDPDDGQSSVAFSPAGKVLVATGIDADIQFRRVAGILWATTLGL
jgi:hypothetical protein